MTRTKQHRDIITALLLFFLYSLNITDGILTIMWVEAKIGEELNPLMAFLLNTSPLGFMLAKIVLVATSIAIFWRMRQHKAVFVAFFFSFFLYLSVNIWHLFIFTSLLT